MCRRIHNSSLSNKDRTIGPKWGSPTPFEVVPDFNAAWNFNHIFSTSWNQNHRVCWTDCGHPDKTMCSDFFHFCLDQLADQAQFSLSWIDAFVNDLAHKLDLRAFWGGTILSNSMLSVTPFLRFLKLQGLGQVSENVKAVEYFFKAIIIYLMALVEVKALFCLQDLDESVRDLNQGLYRVWVLVPNVGVRDQPFWNLRGFGSSVSLLQDL